MNKISIIIPYRDRYEHLSKLLPRLMEVFEGKDYEIIVAEQDNNEKFRLSSIYDTAAKQADGETLIFHDVDYYPSDDVVYLSDSPFYPVKRVIFLDANGNAKKDEDIPGGYRYFKYDVGNHWGGVFVLSMEHFIKINGFNPMYVGWGKEEEDTHWRMLYHGLKPTRGNGTFYALSHKDNGPPMSDPDFIRNHILLQKASEHLNEGYASIDADVEELIMEDIPNVRWLKIKNWRHV